MKILLLEDNADILYHLSERLSEDGHEVNKCHNLYQATEEIEDEKDIECVIVDLNVSPIGLTEDQAIRSIMGMFSGWVWLVDNIYKKNRNVKTIIFSGFIDALSHYLEGKPKEQEYFNKTTLIAKGNIDAYSLLLSAVKGRGSSRKPTKEGLQKPENVALSDETKPEEISVFLSFCSLDKDIADIVADMLERNYKKAVSITRWENDVRYKDSFKEFMDTAKSHDFLFSVISDQYLKSRPCMYEVGRIINEPTFQNKILFIVLSDEDRKYYKTYRKDSIAANIYDDETPYEYITYWKRKLETHERKIAEIGLDFAGDELVAVCQEIKDIMNIVRKFIRYISDARGEPFENLIETNFKVVIDDINAVMAKRKQLN